MAKRERGPSTTMQVWKRPPLPKESPEPTKRTVTGMAARWYPKKLAGRAPLLRGCARARVRSDVRRRLPGRGPAAPGVYRFHDAAGGLLYIGKAANLRRRLGQYRLAGRRKKERKRRALVRPRPASRGR